MDGNVLKMIAHIGMTYTHGCTAVFLREQRTELYREYFEGAAAVENTAVRQDLLQSDLLRRTAGRRGV